MSRHNFDAAIFDLDGVVTDTAEVHASAWKELFDTYLRLRESPAKEPFSPFDKESEYLRNHYSTLKETGADLVVKDLVEIA